MSVRRYLLDTGPALDFLFRRRGIDDRVREVRRAGARVGIGMPTLGEIAAGLEASDSRERSWEIADRSLNQFVFWPFDESAALEYGRIFAELKRVGRPMQQIDMQIAAIARLLANCVLVSYDSDLTAVSGLTVQDWSEASS